MTTPVDTASGAVKHILDPAGRVVAIHQRRWHNGGWVCVAWARLVQFTPDGGFGWEIKTVGDGTSHWAETQQQTEQRLADLADSSK